MSNRRIQWADINHCELLLPNLMDWINLRYVWHCIHKSLLCIRMAMYSHPRWRNQYEICFMWGWIKSRVILLHVRTDNNYDSVLGVVRGVTSENSWFPPWSRQSHYNRLPRLTTCVRSSNQGGSRDGRVNYLEIVNSFTSLTRKRGTWFTREPIGGTSKDVWKSYRWRCVLNYPTQNGGTTHEGELKKQ